VKRKTLAELEALLAQKTRVADAETRRADAAEVREKRLVADNNALRDVAHETGLQLAHLRGRLFEIESAKPPTEIPQPPTVHYRGGEFSAPVAATPYGRETELWWRRG
jgi:hypothetical protein